MSPAVAIKPPCPLCAAGGVIHEGHLDERWDGPELHLSRWWCANGHFWTIRSMPWGNDERRMMKQMREAVKLSEATSE